ncbi:MAG: iron ABC transporter permease [Gammaproteobacteria bacterium]|nr:iron ABC transporter permease [Gammaproteobacteria bacterium]MBQ0841147.1 iron ABC transporter permease [Gammaproteobacteria bacterium]
MLLCSGLVLLVVAMLSGAMLGPVSIPLSSLLDGLATVFGFTVQTSEGLQRDLLIVSAIRLPRMLLAALVGASLALCGAAMQGLFRNPLADPSLIGVSAGASLGASLMIFTAGVLLPGGTLGHLSQTVLSQAVLPEALGLPLMAGGAFIGGSLAVLVVYRLATGGGNSSSGTSVATMLLAGIAISALAGAGNSLLSFYADNEMLRRISLWQMGRLDGANWPRVWMAGTALALLLAGLLGQSRALNALLLGESEARFLGIDVEHLKRRVVLLTALGIGVSVAVAGAIAFVGLVVPHIVRLVIGPDHRYLLPASALLGASLLVFADTLSRLVVAPAELPVGIVTALLGVPFFFSLLARQRRTAA